MFIGEGAAFEGRQGTTLVDFADGRERTLLVVEAADRVPWTKPVHGRSRQSRSSQTNRKSDTEGVTPEFRTRTALEE